MSEMERLIDAGSEEEQALLRAARGDRAPRRVRAHVVASLGVASGIAATAGSASAGLLGIAKWLGAGMVAGALVSGSATLLVERPAQRGDPTRQISPVPRAPALAGPALRVGESPRAALPATVAESPAKKAVAATSPEVTPADAHRLAEELASLDRARAALAAGDGSRALRELDRHAQEFPKGALAPESQVLRVESLLRTGQRARAAAAARRFLEIYGRGPHASRVRSLLAQAEPSSSAFPPSE